MKFVKKKVLSDDNQNKISDKSCVTFKRDDIKKFQKDTIKMLRQGMSICDKLESTSVSCDDLLFEDESLFKKLDECLYEKKGTFSDGF